MRKCFPAGRRPDIVTVDEGDRLDEKEADQALADLIADHNSVLRRYAYRLLGGEEDAEEAVNDVWYAAHRQLRRGGHVEHWLSWLLKVTGYKAADVRKKRGKQAVPVAFETGWPGGAGAELDAVEDRALLRAAVDKVLRDKQTTAAGLYTVWARVEGLSDAQIAEQLGICVSTVDKTRRRTYRALREAINALSAEQTNRPVTVRPEQERGQ